VIYTKFLRRERNPKHSLKFCRLCELNEVLGPVALSDNWMRALAGLRRWLSGARARAGHREYETRQQECLGS
jgi:hypothetical protein